MNLLAIDTATEMCSVALLRDSDLFIREAIAPKSHTELILPMVDAVLTEANTKLTDVNALAFDRGPGAFTGLRIGAAVVQGLALGANLPVAAISSLAILAQGAWELRRCERVLSCIDARKQEVYWGCYVRKDDRMVLIGEEHVCAASQVHTPSTEKWYGTGTGFDSYQQELICNTNVRLSEFAGKRYPLAQHMLPLALHELKTQNNMSVAQALPVYLRDDVATPPTTQKEPR